MTIRTGSATAVCFGAVVCLVLTVGNARADAWDDLSAAWIAGDVGGARTILSDLPDEDRATSAGAAWIHLLADDPGQLDLLRTDDPAVLLDAAWIAWGRGDRDEAASHLAAARVPDRDPLPGAEFLAGLLARRAGDPDRAREFLASVRPDDPSFAWARYTLGRMAAADGDPVLARRYFDNADDADPPLCSPDILAANWELVRGADPRQAKRLERELANRFPESLPLIRVRELDRRRLAAETEADAVAAPSNDRSDGTPAVEHSSDEGRFTLQLIAFADRDRALTYRDEWRATLGDVEVVSGVDADGHAVYRVRVGRFETRKRAAERAESLRREHDLSCMVVEREPGS